MVLWIIRQNHGAADRHRKLCEHLDMADISEKFTTDVMRSFEKKMLIYMMNRGRDGSHVLKLVVFG